jgi:hypothetical protein
MADLYSTAQYTSYLGSASKATGQEVRSVEPLLYQVVDDNAMTPLLAVQSKIKHNQVAINPKHDWYKTRLYPIKDTVVTGASAGATIQVVVSDADYFQLDDVVEFPNATLGAATQTRHGVITTKSTVTLTITPIDHSGSITNMCAVAAGEPICLVSNSSGDNSTMPGMRVAANESDYNYIQFIRVPFGVGLIADAAQDYTGSLWQTTDDKTRVFAKRMIENVLLFGTRGYRTNSTGGNSTYNDYQYFSQGIVPYLVNNAGSNLLSNFLSVSESQFDEFWLTGPGRGGSIRRNWFLSAEAFAHINSWAKTKERIATGTAAVPQLNMLGLAVTRYQAADGKILNLIPHYGISERYPGAGVIVDPAYAHIVPYAKYGTLMKVDNREATALAGKASEYWWMATLALPILEWHAWVYN